MTLRYSYASELSNLASLVKPQALKNARVVAINQSLVAQLALPKAWTDNNSLLQMLFSQPSPYTEHAIAQKYGGHQFGYWNPDLGDGRGLLLAQWSDPQGRNWDLHLKGAGPTPYSRFADGRAVLRSTIREYLASEALHYLGIPTSRALCLITSEESVFRERQERGAMLVRTCESHLRFGHFEYFYRSGEHDKLQQLFDYTFAQHFPHCLATPLPYQSMLNDIVDKTAQMIAYWQAYGFNHGVMNTDNMSIHGITFDYGPYAFLDDFDPNYICNHSDPQGRYSFDSQPGIGLWNLNALAQAFSPYLDLELIRTSLRRYEPQLLTHYSDLMRAKCGLSIAHPDNPALINEWLAMLAAEHKDYSQSFRLLSEHPAASLTQLRDQFVHRERFDRWAQAYAKRVDEQGLDETQRLAHMCQVNPAVILRNFQAQRVITLAEQGDFSLFHEYLQALSEPYTVSAGMQKFTQTPPDNDKGMALSCSS